jgi:hypothetical protein
MECHQVMGAGQVAIDFFASGIGVLHSCGEFLGDEGFVFGVFNIQPLCNTFKKPVAFDHDGIFREINFSEIGRCVSAR